VISRAEVLGRGSVISEKQVWAALPSSGFLRSYVEWASQWVEANVAFHMVAGLTLLSQTVPVEFGFPDVIPLRANLYGLLAGPSSAAGKTRSIEAAKSVLRLAAPAAEMPPPGSPEGFIDALNGRPQIIFYDEFGQFLQSTESGQLSPLRLRFADVYDCGRQGRVLVKRKGANKKEVEENPRLSILAGGTPGFLEEYTSPIDWMEGFLARFFTVLATSERRLRATTAFGGDAVRDSIGGVLKTLANAGANDLFRTDSPCRGTSREAGALLETWKDNLRWRADGAPVTVQAAVHRAFAHALKVALLLAWESGRPQNGEWRVERDDVDAAIAMTELHVESVIEIAEGLAVDRDARDERALLRSFDEDEPKTYGAALKAAKLNNRRGAEARTTLLEKNQITRAPSTDMMEAERFVRVKTARVVVPFRRPEKREGREKEEGAIPASPPTDFDLF